MTVVSADRVKFAQALAGLIDPLGADKSEKLILTMIVAMSGLPDTLFRDPSGLAARLAPQFDRFPNAARLNKALLAEMAATQVAVSLPYADESSLDDADRLMIKFWQMKTGFGTYEAMASIASWTHRIFPRAAAVLYRDDDLWRRIADQRNWQPDDVRDRLNTADWGDGAGIVRIISHIREHPYGATRSGWRAALLAALARHAPQHIPLVDIHDPPSDVPDDMPDEHPSSIASMAAVQFEAQNGRKMGQLSPEQLAAARRVAGSPLRPMPPQQTASVAAPLVWDDT